VKEGKTQRFYVRRILPVVFAFSLVFVLLGTISAFAATNLLKAQNARLGDLSAGASGTITAFDEVSIESDVVFHKLGDTAEYVVTLKNIDDKDHIIQSIADDNANPYVSYEYAPYVGTLVKAGESFDFIVTAKYANAVTDKDARVQATNVKFSFRFADVDEPQTIVIAPKTGDSITINVATLIVSATCLFICALVVIKHRKKHAKVFGVVVAIISTVAVASSVYAVAAQTSVGSIIANYSLYDKVVVAWTDANGDKHEESVSHGESVTIPDQNKDGYAFVGWKDGSGNLVDLTEPITSDLEIYPAFRAHKYVIRFNGNGGGGNMDDFELSFDETKALPASAFSYSGHAHADWATEADGSGAHYGDQAEVKNLTVEDGDVVMLYAQWSINSFRINYDGNGATSGEMAATDCEYDQSCTLRKNAFERTDYNFAGWKYGDGDYVDEADVRNIVDSGEATLHAQWNPKTYSLSYDYGDAGDPGNPTEYTVEDLPLTLSKPTKVGYVTEGWIELPSTSIMQDVTIISTGAPRTFKAVYRPVQYTVQLHGNGGTKNSGAVETVNCSYDSDCVINNVYTNHVAIFGGWNTAANGSGTSYGTTVKNLASEDGAIVNLYAKWEGCLDGEICYDGNGNTAGTMVKHPTAGNTEATLFASNFSRDGYAFIGWGTTSNGPVVYGESEIIATPASGGLILYAQWLAPTDKNATLQGFNKNAEPYASLSVNSTVALRDTRDDQVYAVTKLADGNWWMTENMRLDLADDNLVINSSNTNSPTEEFLTKLGVIDKSQPLGSCDDSSADCFDSVSFENGAVKRTLSSDTFANPTSIRRAQLLYAYEYGVYYNWFTATAGNGTHTVVNGAAASGGDLCPYSWRLPTTDDTTKLYKDMGSNDLAAGGVTLSSSNKDFVQKWYQAPINLVHSGLRTPSRFSSNGAQTVLYTATSNEGNQGTKQAKMFSSKSVSLIGGFSVTPATGGYKKYVAMPIRCLAK